MSQIRPPFVFSVEIPLMKEHTRIVLDLYHKTFEEGEYEKDGENNFSLQETDEGVLIYNVDWCVSDEKILFKRVNGFIQQIVKQFFLAHVYFAWCDYKGGGTVRVKNDKITRTPVKETT